MLYKNLLLCVFITSLVACNSSSSDQENDEKTQLNVEHKINMERISYLSAMNLLQGALSPDLTPETVKNLEFLDKLQQDERQVHAQYAQAQLFIWSEDEEKQIMGKRKLYKLAESGHPYAALNIADELYSSQQSFNDWKKITGLDTVKLKTKEFKYLELALKSNINSAKLSYLYALGINPEFKEVSYKALWNDKNENQYIVATPIAKELVLKTEGYIKGVPYLYAFTRYAELLAYKVSWNDEDENEACAIKKYYDEVNESYIKEYQSQYYKWLSQAMSVIGSRQKKTVINQKECLDHYQLLKNSKRELVTNWTEIEVDLP